MSNENTQERGLTEYEKMILETVAISEEAIAEFNNQDYVSIGYDQFTRIGLPILHGILTGQIHVGAWLQFIGGINQRSRVYDNEGKEYFNIPAVMETVPTNVFEDYEAPTFHSFVSEMNLNRQDNPEMWEVAVTQRLGNSFAEMEPNLKFFIKLNELFKDFGLSEIKPEDFVAKPKDGEETAVEVKQVNEEPKVGGDALDDGELL
jgi:hypothetical protein